MSFKRTLGGDRLGGGKKMEVEMHSYGRSTHNLSEAWRSSMAAGTIVPCFKKVALPGDTFDIDMHAEVMTKPTVGPLYGSYQLQIDFFLTPIRLYEAQLHMNMVGLGMRMQDVILPQIQLKGLTPNTRFGNIDNLQVNPSSLVKYLGISGMGQNPSIDADIIARNFNAVPFLIYWDKYKNYYANKMEQIGAMIHKEPTPTTVTLESVTWYNAEPSPQAIDISIPYTPVDIELTDNGMYMIIEVTTLTNGVPLENFELNVTIGALPAQWRPITDIFEDWQYDVVNDRLIGYNFKFNQWATGPGAPATIGGARYQANEENANGYPTITTFPLENIDNMKLEILRATAPVIITPDFPGYAPYSNILQGENLTTPTDSQFCITFTQEGLALRTYKSDIFNNWLDTEFISGTDGISEITKVTITDDAFTIDELNMSKKLYDMLNRIAVSGGTYDDWQDAVYTHERTRSAETPMYMGGMIQEIIFSEVISTAQTSEAPLGQLAGRGRNGADKRGGKVIVKVDEPSYITANVSIVPNIDYSQGNDWDMNLKTMNDFHKPALDEIGFQDLITDQMAWWDTQSDVADEQTFRSAGKQPAWLNYMTSYNKVYGTFADVNQEQFMVLARRYEMGYDSVPGGNYRIISDLTTYVDPSKFNHIFADTRLDAQNFWVQIGFGVEARRKMSAKLIPNL